MRVQSDDQGVLKRAAFPLCHLPLRGPDGREWHSRCCESIDLDDAHHPQTILAYELNGKPLPVANGAPVRIRIERQLGYKIAKYIMRIELVDSFKNIGGSHGCYGEDPGYGWYAGL